MLYGTKSFQRTSESFIWKLITAHILDIWFHFGLLTITSAVNNHYLLCHWCSFLSPESLIEPLMADGCSLKLAVGQAHLAHTNPVSIKHKGITFKLLRGNILSN